MKEFGKKLILTQRVKYVGDGEDPAEDPYMKAYAKALKEYYSPENQAKQQTKVLLEKT